MLLPRLITAVVGIPLVILAVYWGGVPFFVLMLGIVFLAMQEYFYMAAAGNYKSQPVTGMILGVILFCSIFINCTTLGQTSQNQGTAFYLSLMLIPIFFIEMLKSNRQRSIESIAITFLGAFFIPWTLAHILLIRNLKGYGMSYIFFLFILIWTLDTGAYAVGVKLGRFKLAESVSPKKTIEGAIGGSLTAVIVSIICYFVFLKKTLTLPETVSVGFIISIIAQFSDLSESLLKRDVGIKDSANLLPGHGGMLDRFDSFLFTAPFFYYYLTIIKGF